MGEHSLYPAVYDPIQIGPVEIKNRIFQAPHGSFSRHSPPEMRLADHIYARDADGSPIPRVEILGDARRPERMPKATRDGFFFGWNL